MLPGDADVLKYCLTVLSICCCFCTVLCVLC